MKKKLIQIIIIFILFNNIIFNIIPLPSFVGYWDELTELIIIFVGILLLKNKNSKNYYVIILFIMLICTIGIIGNIMYDYVPIKSSIFRDVINFLKFPLTFIILKNNDFDSKLRYVIDEKFIKIIKFIIIIIFLCGLLSLFINIGMSQNEIRHGIQSYQFLFSHPTYLVLNSLFLLLLIDSYDFSTNKKKNYYQFMLLIIIILTMRTKGIIIAALYIFIKYAGNWLKKFRIIYWIGIILVGYISSIQKLQLYASYTTSPREALYKGSFLLASKCFPFGSGFASFASHISATSESKVYNFISIPFYAVENGNKYAVLGDAGLAYYIGQFGYIGFLTFIIIIIYLYKTSLKKVKNKLPVKILWLYILIALTSESILLNNGIELCFMLLILIGMNKDSNLKNYVNEGN